MREVLPGLPSVSYVINALWPYSAHVPLKTRLAVDDLVKKLPGRLALVGG
ncbi:hypothetical protein [Ottowia sp.]